MVNIQEFPEQKYSFQIQGFSRYCLHVYINKNRLHKNQLMINFSFSLPYCAEKLTGEQAAFDNGTV